ncbi:putative calcium-binding protein [Cocos nucifera]|uniref:Putative calcium-binding protein n=1 Tax=Cocos nucifera TaxID=13894 RepID=A0A8K0IMH3_COCNU|nr:putative calcium-binding protein [Cocos nucifera]
MASERCISCTTFNILAPIYKRLDKEDQSRRESQYRAYWHSRNESIIDRLLGEMSSIICLQEVWLGNEELVDMYERRLGDAGYTSLKLARTNNRGDGLLSAVHRDYFRILNYQDLLFNDFGDRVAQLLHVESVVPFNQSQNSGVRQQILIVNTHLLFPHDSSLCILRLRQVYKILLFIESYQKEHKLSPMPIILCGDWNGSKRGHVYKFLRSQGFVSSYDTAHHYTDSDADAHKVWVSHRNHRGNICGVDFIWLLNPNKHRKPLRTSWNEAVFGIIKYLLRAASLTEDNAFAFLKVDSPGDYITYSGFCQALCQLGLTSHPHGLIPQDIEDLWIQADNDGNGVVDHEEFLQGIWNPKCWEQPENFEKGTDIRPKTGSKRLQAFGFNVKNAVLFPPEVEKGMWPEDYSLSDHAPLTVVFSPERCIALKMDQIVGVAPLAFDLHFFLFPDLACDLEMLS